MVRFSTGAVQGIAADETVKEQFMDGKIVLYSGAQPSLADDAYNGTPLATITKDGNTHVPGTKSTRQISKDVIGSSTEGHVFTLTVDGTAYTYTAGAGSSTTIVAAALAALVDESRVVTALAEGANIWIRARFGGNVFTCVSSGSGTQTVTTPVASARAEGIQFGACADGVLAKESNTWQGDGIADGTIGWFRIYANATDAGGSSATAKRIDGSCSTTSGDMILRSLAAETGIPITIDNFDITFPKVRS